MKERNYYENIPEDEFVPLDCLEEEFNGVYEINNLGHIKTISSGFIRKEFSKDFDGYPAVTLTSKNNRLKKKVIRIHILLARMFIPNPENKPVVDHIIPGKENRGNYDLCNLRWVTYSENNFNRSNNEKNSTIFYVKFDISGNEIKRYSRKDLGDRETNNINNSINKNRLYKGFLWKRIDTSIEDYISKYGNPLDENWKTCLRDSYFECNINGLVRVKKTKRICTCNYPDMNYIRINHKRDQYFSHRLVYETFSGELLDEKEFIDHKNGDKHDNRFENLKKCSQKENMNNPITVARKSKPVLQFSISGEFMGEYSSVKEALDKYSNGGMGNNFIRQVVTYGYLWCYKGDESMIGEKLKFIVFKYDKDFKFVKAFVSAGRASEETSVSRNTIYSYITSGKLCSDGFYYSRGPRNFDKEDV